MAALPLSPGMTRAQADAALAEAVPDAGDARVSVAEPAAGCDACAGASGWPRSSLRCRVIEGWDAPADARYTGPTLFIAGAASDYIRPEHRPMIRSLFPSARFVTLKNAGHWLHADNPSGFVGVVEAFLTATG